MQRVQPSPEERTALSRISPVDLGTHQEDVWMNSVQERPVERRRELQHVDPVGHEADSDVGIPVKPKGEIGLSAALNIGRQAHRLADKKTAAIQIELAEPRGKLPGANPACAYGAYDLDLVKSSRPAVVGPVACRARFTG